MLTSALYIDYQLRVSTNSSKENFGYRNEHGVPKLANRWREQTELS